MILTMMVGAVAVYAADAQDIVRVELSEEPIAQGNTAGCGPVSLLNLLKLGPAEFSRAYHKISRGDDDAALKRLAKEYCSSDGNNNKPRFSFNSGIDDPNLTRLCQDVFKSHELGSIDTLYTNREKNESNTAFAARINSALLRSLSSGIPVLMSIDSYGVEDNQWSKLSGHYMLITGAQRIGKSNPESFLIEFVDPVGAEHRQAFVYASTRRQSKAIAHFAKGDQWLEENPYLYIAAPSKNLSESRQSWKQRHEYYLTILFGRLKSAPKETSR